MIIFFKDEVSGSNVSGKVPPLEESRKKTQYEKWEYQELEDNDSVSEGQENEDVKNYTATTSEPPLEISNPSISPRRILNVPPSKKLKTADVGKFIERETEKLEIHSTALRGSRLPFFFIQLAPRTEEGS